MAAERSLLASEIRSGTFLFRRKELDSEWQEMQVLCVCISEAIEDGERKSEIGGPFGRRAENSAYVP